MMSASKSRRRVVVIEPGYEHYDVERDILSPFEADVEPVTWDGDEGIITRAVAGADAVLVRESPISGKTLAGLAPGAVVVRYGVGVDNIDLEAAKRRRIYVANVPSYGVDAVSDHAVALMLAVSRRIVSRDRAVRGGAWGVGQKEKVLSPRGATLGIVGFGRIARRTLEKLRPFGFAPVLVHDPYLDAADAAAADVRPVGLDDLCRAADVITLHAPLSAETHHLIDAAHLGLMKPTAILINVGRGPLVDEAALVRTLSEGRLFGAGIDVFEQEPPAAGHPLFGLDNVVLSDHTAWYSDDSVRELQSKAAEEVARVFRGETPLSWINRWEGQP